MIKRNPVVARKAFAAFTIGDSLRFMEAKRNLEADLLNFRPRKRFTKDGGWRLDSSHVETYHQVFNLCLLTEEDVSAMSYPQDIPNPTQEYPDFIVRLMACKEVTNLLHYRLAAGKNVRLWLVSAAQHIGSAIEDEIVEISLSTAEGGERYNVFHPLDGAREFWNNGLTQGLEPGAILEGWRAMQSILKDGSRE